MPNELILNPDRPEVAYVNRELATTRDQSARDPNGPFRVSDMYVSRYGVLGYVEMNTNYGIQAMGNILEIPHKLVQSIKEVRGMWGYVKEVVFSDTDITENEENTDHPSLQGTQLFDSKYYYYYPNGGYGNVESARVAEAIKDNEASVIDFLAEIDGVLDRFVPEDKRPTFDSLPLLGPGLVE